MPASPPTLSPRFWLLIVVPLAFLAGIAGLQLGSLTAPPTPHEAGSAPPPAPRGDAPSSIRPALTLAKPRTTTAGTAHSSPAPSESRATQPTLSAVPAKVTVSQDDERARQFLASIRARAPSPVEAVDPYLPGHSIASNGQRVFIETSRVIPESGQNEFGAVLVPDPESSSSSHPESSPALSSASPAASRSLYSRIGVGFTPEELAFRAKWGWAAHNAVLRAAFEEADGAP